MATLKAKKQPKMTAKKRPKMTAKKKPKLTAKKADIMLREGKVRGKKLTDKQIKLFGAIASGNKRKK